MKSIGDKFEFHIYIFLKMTRLSLLNINKITVIVSLLHTYNKSWNQVKTLMIISCLIYFDIVLGTFVIMYRNDHFNFVYHSQT